MKRLQKQFVNVLKMSEQGVFVKQKQSLFHWQLTIQGPLGTPFEGGSFIVDVDFPQQFPFKFPNFQFRTPIWHPNIKQGKICKEMLGQKQWQPNKKVQQIIETILSMLVQPDIGSSINLQAAKQFKQGTYAERAKQDTLKYAMKKQ